MNYAEMLGLLATLAGGDPDPEAFAAIKAGGADAAFPVAVAPCPRPIGRAEIEGETIVCGTVSVPENHSASDGPRVDLFFTVLAARSAYATDDPIVHLHGGPGAGILESIEGYARIFDKMRETRDIVMFDQRAAGLSGATTTCAAAFSENIVEIVRGTARPTSPGPDGRSTSALLENCIAELDASGIGLSDYNTYQNALDVPAVMGTLGYDIYNIYGISYGTKLALEVMRSAPEGLRSVIIDGVAPPDVPLYDTLAQPLSEAMSLLVDYCAADPACDGAYPELGRVLGEVIAGALAGTLLDANGNPVPIVNVILPFVNRNGDFRGESMTPYLPAMIYELHRDGSGPTVDFLTSAGFRLPPPDPAAPLKAARAGLSTENQRLLDMAVAHADAIRVAENGLDLSVDALRDARAPTVNPLGVILDEELSRAARPIYSDMPRTEALARDLAALLVDPSPGAFRAFVDASFDAGDAARINAIVDAMTGDELAEVFASLARSLSRIESKLAGDLHLWVYACQEDIPFNSSEGFAELSAGLDWPIAGAVFQELAGEFYASCEAFEPSPRDGFWTPVESDIPTLAIGSGWDTQTAASWAAKATETLANSQSFVIPEAGHGAIVYQPCVADMAVAFFNDPGRRLDDSCVRQATPAFHIAPTAE